VFIIKCTDIVQNMEKIMARITEFEIEAFAIEFLESSGYDYTIKTPVGTASIKAWGSILFEMLNND